MSHYMNSVELIRKLSDQGAEDLSQALSWINPIPTSAEDIIEKIDIASKRLQYAQARQGSSEQDDTTRQRAILSRLKTEIKNILGSN